MAASMGEAPRISFDDLLPVEMARKGEEIGIRKANLDFLSMMALAVLAGAFISVGAIFATVSLTTTGVAMPWGWGRVVAGIVFSLGLILVIVGGAELFTGNNLIVMAWASRRLSTKKLLRNWGIVYFGNLVGAGEFTGRPGQDRVPQDIYRRVTRARVKRLLPRRFPLIQFHYLIRCQSPAVYTQLINRPGKPPACPSVHTYRENIE